jgi:uncharacterized OB-fold protein
MTGWHTSALARRECGHATAPLLGPLTEIGQCRIKTSTSGWTPVLSRRPANVFFPPRPFCPSCASRKVSIFKASGKGTLYSYVINHRPAAPGFTPPYAIAVVELDEGPRMMSNIIDCPQTPEALELDMKLEVAFEKLDDKITLPLFRPAKG